MSLISIIQGASRRINYPQPMVGIGTTDPNIALLVDCAQDAGDDAVERVNWQSLKLQTPAQFIGDGVTAAFPLPVGFQAFAPSDVFVSNLYPTWKLPGPVSEGDLLRLKALPMAIPVHVWRQVGGATSAVISTPGTQVKVEANGAIVSGLTTVINMAFPNTFGILPGWTVVDQNTSELLGTVLSYIGNTLTLTAFSLGDGGSGNDILVFTGPPTSSVQTGLIVPMVEFFPVLGVGEVITFVYAQGGWITNAAGQQYPTPLWQADSDLSLLPERLIRLGAVWRWKRRKGFDYSEEMNDYEGALDRLGGMEDTSTVISMSDDIGAYDTWPGIITDNTDSTF